MNSVSCLWQLNVVRVVVWNPIHQRNHHFPHLHSSVIIAIIGSKCVTNRSFPIAYLSTIKTTTVREPQDSLHTGVGILPRLKHRHVPSKNLRSQVGMHSDTFPQSSKNEEHLFCASLGILDEATFPVFSACIVRFVSQLNYHSAPFASEQNTPICICRQVWFEPFKCCVSTRYQGKPIVWIFG